MCYHNNLLFLVSWFWRTSRHISIYLNPRLRVRLELSFVVLYLAVDGPTGLQLPRQCDTPGSCLVSFISKEERGFESLDSDAWWFNWMHGVLKDQFPVFSERETLESVAGMQSHQRRMLGPDLPSSPVTSTSNSSSDISGKTCIQTAGNFKVLNAGLPESWATVFLRDMD